MNMSSRTAVLVSAMATFAGAGFGQAQQNTASQTAQNFYITTPQTGRQVAAGTRVNSTAGQVGAQRAPVTIIPQQQTSRATAISTSAQSGDSVAETPRRVPTQNFYTNHGYTVQQVSNPAPAIASSRVSSRSSSSSRRGAAATTSARQPNFYSQAQTNPAYVSNANASHTHRRGFFSRLLHPHDHRQESQQKQQTRAESNIKPSKLAGTRQAGVASWYGGKWHGRKTANGERYDQNTMTAAHKTLPFGTLVRVKNERNGRECVVRINNRGPFTKGRIIDLSKAAASKLGMVSSGVTKVTCEVIGRT